MAKLTKETLFKQPATRAETLLDKTTRAAKEIIDGENEERTSKTMRLRKARLEREAYASSEDAPLAAGKARKKSRAKGCKAG